MSSRELERLPLSEALEAAKAAVRLFAPACIRIEIAGSIRRQSPTIGDIELVAQPKFEPCESNLFGEASKEKDLLHELCEQLLARGEISHRVDRNGLQSFGPKYKRLTFRGIGLDLFAVTPPAEWGVILALRTGPEEFNRRLVVPMVKGGFLPMGMRFEDGRLLDRGRPVPTPLEEDLFAAIGMDFIAPSDRR